MTTNEEKRKTEERNLKEKVDKLAQDFYNLDKRVNNISNTINRLQGALDGLRNQVMMRKR